jgi:hypothetical protein
VIEMLLQINAHSPIPCHRVFGDVPGEGVWGSLFVNQPFEELFLTPEECFDAFAYSGRAPFLAISRCTCPSPREDSKTSGSH